jgi:hypothetical protein
VSGVGFWKGELDKSLIFAQISILIPSLNNNESKTNRQTLQAS